MSIKKLTVENAQIKTASVEVKTLTISGKQVTLAVFRQLEEEHVLDENTCEPVGMTWGRINYHPDKACSQTGPHIHIVWQKGNELKRCMVHTPAYVFGRLSVNFDFGWESHFRVINNDWREDTKDKMLDDPTVKAYEAWKAAYKNFWEYCQSLDQLFIAV